MKVELLAPAGSFDSLKAACEAGADAIYIGGTKFGARAYADNLAQDDMIRAIEYAHLKHKKIYMTVNTLLKEQEIGELYDYLYPYVEAGLDAAIVQDMGVFQYLHEKFPMLDLHASTQMTITGARGAALLKEMGAVRIVTARELSFDEIRKIHEQVDIEIESFVHGALCYCYSGQCLLSSMIGGRSGNRGRCAQPCRLEYSLQDAAGKQLNRRPYTHLLSPKDMCTLELIPQLVESGIYSFKIEGRMKRPEYTAGVVRIYRKYIDRYLKEGKQGYRVAEEDMQELMDLYNRGGFTKGYYQQHNGPDMMSMSRPNHWGTIAAEVIGMKKNTLQCRASEPLHVHDVVEIRDGKKSMEVMLKEDISAKRPFVLKISDKDRWIGEAVRSHKALTVYRTKNAFLLKELEQAYLLTKTQEKINGKLILYPGKSAILEVHYADQTIRCEGAEVQTAQNRPMTAGDIEKQIRKTGGTSFIFDRLEVDMGDQVFIPMQALNELRRNALACLEKWILDSQKPDMTPVHAENLRYTEESNQMDTEITDGHVVPAVFVSVQNRKQFTALLGLDDIAGIYIDHMLYTNSEDLVRESEAVINGCHRNGLSCRYAMPWIFREEASSYYEDPEVRAALCRYDAILIRNLEEYQFLREIGYEGEIVTDHNLYTWNRQAKKFWNERGIRALTVPVEENFRELKQRGCCGDEMIVYGYQPLMISAQCQFKNHTGCTKKPSVAYLRDRKNKLFMVCSECDVCCNVIYNTTPLFLLQDAEDIRSLGPASIRLSFTKEDPETAIRITGQFAAAFSGTGIDRDDRLNDYTRGHFRRGVE